MRTFVYAIVVGLAAYSSVARSARADLQLNLSVAVQNAAAGASLVFSGTVANTSATDRVFLNSIQVSFSGAAGAFGASDSNTFFANVPGILLPNESYAGPLFQVSLPANAPYVDYPGTVAVLGGNDVSASSTLATSSFKVLSPAVQIVATTPGASEFGPVPGHFTISRTGSTDTDLPIVLSIAGTAVNGASYDAVPSSIDIPPGFSSSTVAVTPIPDNVAEGDRSVILSLLPSTAYNAGIPAADTVTIHDKPIDAWRLAVFGPLANSPTAADGADPSGSGIVNLISYGLNLSVANPSLGALPSYGISGGRLTLSFVKNPAATDVSFSVEASLDLQNWSAAEVQDVTPANPNPPTLQVFQYGVPIGSVPNAFLRLNVTRLDATP